MLVQGSEWAVGPLTLRVMAFAEAGDTCIGHKHNFDHLTFVNRGKIRIQRLHIAPGGAIRCVHHRYDDATNAVVEDTFQCEVESEVVITSTDVRNFFNIAAGVFHRITAEADDSQCICAFPHRDALGRLVEAYEGNRAATL